MSREIKAVALAIYTQLVHDNITLKQADKLVATIGDAWRVRDVPFDVQAFENLALRGMSYDN